MNDPGQQYFDNFRSVEASLPQLMGGWMSALSHADLQRQLGWLQDIQALSTPDDKGNVPLINLVAGLTDAGGKEQIGITSPLVLAMLGKQFAATAATFDATINVSENALDQSQAQSKGSAAGSGSYGILGFHVGIHLSASFATSESHKRATDFRSSIVAHLEMARVDTAEPIQRILEAFLTLVDAEAAIAKSRIVNAKNAQLQPAPAPG